MRWRYWLPGFVLAVISGLLMFLALLAVSGWNVAVCIVAPFCIGAIVGYGCRAKPFVLGLLALAGLAVIVFTLYTLEVVGLFCGTVLAIVALAPILTGTLVGFLLRVHLKGTDFQQRWYLPIFVLLLAPLLVGVIERLTLSPHAIETVATSVEIPASAGRTWNAIMFYEEVKHRPPWLLRYGLPRPLYTRGSTAAVGNQKTCFYTKGHLAKRVTRRVPNQLLAFDVTEQDHIENHSVRLTSGSFVLHEEGPRLTRVELTTSYQPKLGPRWVWRPFEQLAIHTLHGHVLEGMRLQATSTTGQSNEATR